MFTRQNGAHLNPDYVTRRFKELTRGTELPVIKFHGTRHTAAPSRSKRTSPHEREAPCALPA